MAIQYFPRIDDFTAVKITEELITKSVAEASEISAVSHPDAYHYSTASVQVTEETLRNFRRKVLVVADDLGFPQPLNSNRARELDQRLSEILFNDLDLIPAEAANAEVWNFLTLVVLPDIAKWRYPNEKKILDYNRWLGGDRNVVRKLWWREATLGHDLNSRLGEDEAVGIMERPLLGGQTPVARAMVRALLKMEKEFPGTARSELLRAGAVNLRRYAPFTAFEFFSEEDIYKFVLDIFRSSSEAYVERLRQKKSETGQESAPEGLDLENHTGDAENQREIHAESQTPTAEKSETRIRAPYPTGQTGRKPSVIERILGRK